MKVLGQDPFVWATAYVFGLWLVAGVLLSWGRSIKPAILAPLFVAVLPAVAFPVVGGSAFRFELLPLGSDFVPYIRAAMIPMLGSVIGGHIAMAINPDRRDRKRTKAVLQTANASLDRYAADTEELMTAMRRVSEERADAPEISSPGVPTPAVSEASKELTLLRVHLAGRERQLLEARRRIAS